MKIISRRFVTFMLAAFMAALVIQMTGFADTEGLSAWIVGSADTADASFTMEDGNVAYVEDLVGAFADEDFVNTYSGAKIKLLKDINSEDEFNLGSSSCYTLDLNGHTISCSLVSKSGGKLTIKDSSSDENGTISGKCNFMDLEELTIDGGNFICPTDIAYCAVHLYNCSNTTINGGNFKGRYNGLDIDFSDVTINGGTFIATGPIYIDDINFHGGVVAGLRYSSTTYNSDTVRIKGGTFTGVDFAIQMGDTNPVMTEVRDFLGNSDTDPERYAFYKGDEPIKYNDASLDGKTLEGPITVKLCEHADAVYTSSNDGVHHTFNCEICGANDVKEECEYGEWVYKDNDMHKASCEHCHQEKTAEHNYIIDKTKSNDKQHTFICEDCGHEKSEDHTSTKEATCTERAVCDVCKMEYGNLAEHNLVKTDYNAPTCTEQGNKEYWTCSNCNKIFSDEKGNNIFVGEIIIPAKGHTEEVIPAVPATCEEEGLTEGLKCSVCGKIIKEPQTIPALGHKEEVIPAVPATCEEEGSTEGLKCSVCGKIIKAPQIIPALGHKEEAIPAVDATCEEEGLTEGLKCSVCGKIIKEPQTIPAVPATCEEEGLTEGLKCSVCGKIIKEPQIIPALGHKEEVIPAVDATCEEEGLTEGLKCSVCGKIIKAPQIIPTLGHKEEVIPAVDATCEKDGSTEGSKCSVCGKIIKEPETVPAAGHNPGEEWYSDANNHWHECTKCNEHIDIAVHIKDEGTIVNGESRIDAGMTMFKCKVCGYVIDTVSIPEETTAAEITALEDTTDEETTAAEETSAPEEMTSPKETTVTIAETTDSGEKDGNLPTGIAVTVIPLALTAVIAIAANKFKHK